MLKCYTTTGGSHLVIFLCSHCVVLASSPCTHTVFVCVAASSLCKGCVASPFLPCGHIHIEPCRCRWVESCAWGLEVVCARGFIVCARGLVICVGLCYYLHMAPRLHAAPRGCLCTGFVVICVQGLIVCACDHKVVCAQGLIVCAWGLVVVCGQGLCGACV